MHHSSVLSSAGDVSLSASSCEFNSTDVWRNIYNLHVISLCSIKIRATLAEEIGCCKFTMARLDASGPLTGK